MQDDHYDAYRNQYKRQRLRDADCAHQIQAVTAQSFDKNPPDSVADQVSRKNGNYARITKELFSEELRLLTKAKSAACFFIEKNSKIW